MDICILCSITLLQSSCIPPSQHISQVKCWKKQLRTIVFDWTAVLFSERVSNCTNTLHFGEFSKCFFLRRNSGFIHVVLSVFLILMGVHRVHDCEKHGLPVPIETYPESIHTGWWSACCERSRRGICARRSHPLTALVLQCRINESTSGMSLACSAIQDMLGRITVQAMLKHFLLSSSFCQEAYPSLNCPVRGCLKVDSRNSAKSSYITAPSSSRWTDSSCRSNLIMNFDTSNNLV